MNLKYTGLSKQQKTTKNCKQTWNNLKSVEKCARGSKEFVDISLVKINLYLIKFVFT
jgi:hypothetical protein